MSEVNVEYIGSLIKLVKEHNITKVTIGDIIIENTNKPVPVQVALEPQKQFSDEEILMNPYVGL